MEKSDVIGVIDANYQSMSKGHKAIADFVKNSYETAVFMTAANIGKEIGVSESTVVRFASNLGYDGFPEFQKYFSEWVKSRMNVVQKIGAKYANSSNSQIINSILMGDIERINDTIENIDSSAFESAVDILLSARKVYILGIRSCAPLAQFLAFYLGIMRDNVICINTTNSSEVFEQMVRINEEDAFVGISFPRYSVRTLKAMEFATDRNAQVITITDSDRSPMCMYSKVNLCAKSEMVSIVDSLVAPLSVINALIVAFCLKSPETVKDDLGTLEEVWDNYQVYLNDEINYIDNDMLLNHPLIKESESDNA